jgi:Flp pilus assembly protein TadG
MRKRALHRGRRSRGQSLVEFALLLPIILILMAAVFDIGRVLDASIVLTNAVRTGARFGSIHPTWYDSVRARVIDFANNSGMNFTGVQLEAANVSVVMSTAPGASVIVTVDYDLPLYFGRIVGLSTIHIQRSAEMMVMSGN